jgi:hypothetical protein
VAGKPMHDGAALTGAAAMDPQMSAAITDVAMVFRCMDDLG